MAEAETAVSPQVVAQHLKTSLDIKGMGAGLATAAVVGVGVALIEVAWIPGIVIGVAAMALPKFFPSLSQGGEASSSLRDQDRLQRDPEDARVGGRGGRTG